MQRRREKKIQMANDSFAIFQLKCGSTYRKKSGKREAKKRWIAVLCISCAFYSMFFFHQFRSFDEFSMFSVQKYCEERNKRHSNHQRMMFRISNDPRKMRLRFWIVTVSFENKKLPEEIWWENLQKILQYQRKSHSLKSNTFIMYICTCCWWKSNGKDRLRWKTRCDDSEMR